MSMTERHAKGFYIESILNYVKTKFDAETTKQILSKIPSEVLNEKYNPIEWYPNDYVTRVFDGIISSSGNDEKLVAQRLVGAGFALAEEGANRFMKYLFKVLTPKMFATKLPSLWTRHHDFGELTLDLAHIDENSFSYNMTAYDGLHYIGIGWAEWAFGEGMRKQNVHASHNCPEGQIFGPYGKRCPEVVRIEVKWD